MNLLFFFLNVLTIAFKLLLLISEFLGVRMFRLVEQTCHRFKRRGKEWFLFGQLIGSWSAPVWWPWMTFVLETEKAYWSVFRYCYVICHGCQMYFLWNPLSVESLECCHFSIISNKEGVFLLTFLFENFIFTECMNCFY